MVSPIPPIRISVSIFIKYPVYPYVCLHIYSKRYNTDNNQNIQLTYRDKLMPLSFLVTACVDLLMRIHSFIRNNVDLLMRIGGVFDICKISKTRENK